MAEMPGERIPLGSSASLGDSVSVELLVVVQLWFCPVGFFILISI